MIEDVFCKILSGELKGDFVYRDEDVAVIKDIHPQAPVHLLVMPVKHFNGLEDFTEHDGHLLEKMLRVAHRVAQEQGMAEGYRLIINEGQHSGKLVPHLHMHLLGGKRLGPKMVMEG
ncbi:MAG TPA: HIT domain-containing protein [Candidatus Paceibacterota bacterium]|nr:HIT domain-containing protein [Candidatus Paceibacterota bacterium]